RRVSVSLARSIDKRVVLPKPSSKRDACSTERTHAGRIDPGSQFAALVRSWCRALRDLPSGGKFAEVGDRRSASEEGRTETRGASSRNVASTASGTESQADVRDLRRFP